MTLSIFDAAAGDGDRVGLIADGAAFTFAELADRVSERQPPAVLVAERTVDSALAIYAALAAARPIALVHPRLTATERAALPPPVGPGITVYTSGSTGAPKPVALSPAMLLAAAAGSAAHLGWRDDDRWLSPIPLAHVGGLSVLTRCLIARRCAVLDDLDALATQGITLASVVPTLLARMVERDAPPTLRAVLVGGAPCPPRLLERARARGYRVLATYGMTEACSQIATERVPGGGLEPLVNLQLRVRDGHIQVRGPAIAAEGWLDTGDLGHLDERGRLLVLGRADDLIITGGENVHPSEVERALLDLPQVREACVFGVPDPDWGQLVAAALVASSALTDAALAEHVATVLAPHKRPRRFCRVDALPRTGAGKLDRAATARNTRAALRPLRV